MLAQKLADAPQLSVPTGLSKQHPSSEETLTLNKSTKCRIGVTLQNSKTALVVASVTPGSVAESIGFRVGDVVLAIGDMTSKEIRFSKHKANGLLFDARGSCDIRVQRGAVSVPRAMEVDRPKATGLENVENEEAPPSIADARAAAEAKVAAAMAEAGRKAKAKAAEKAAAELKQAEEVKRRAEEKAAAVAKAAEAAAARRREAEEKKEAALRAAEAAVAAKRREAEEARARAAEATAKANAMVAAAGGQPEHAMQLRSASARLFAVGDAVTYEHAGDRVEATVKAVHSDKSPVEYTIAVGMLSRRASSVQLTARPTAGGAAGGKRGRFAVAEIPAFGAGQSQRSPLKKRRLGARARPGNVPGLDLAARGIGANAQPIAKKKPFGLGLGMNYA